MTRTSIGGQNGKRHALVVGGTGMLREVSLALARSGYVVSVVARDAARLQGLADEAAVTGGHVHSIAVDYRDAAALERALADARERRGPIMLAVVWVHDDAPEAPYAIARQVGTAGSPGRYVHVLGSGAAEPGREAEQDARRDRFKSFPGIQYQEVVLGFVRECNGARWLAHDEIVDGVLAAVARPRPVQVVGTVRPWTARPAQ
jgi:NAD(P)-dependent dehydrogenase (short-subunit alcohol dehydrogenase family)